MCYFFIIKIIRFYFVFRCLRTHHATYITHWLAPATRCAIDVSILLLFVFFSSLAWFCGQCVYVHHTSFIIIYNSRDIEYSDKLNAILIWSPFKNRKSIYEMCNTKQFRSIVHNSTPIEIHSFAQYHLNVICSVGEISTLIDFRFPFWRSQRCHSAK